MTRYEEQTVALAAIFEACLLVDQLARNGTLNDGPASCMVRSILNRNPETVLDTYGGNTQYIRQGLDALEAMLARDGAALQRDALRYTMNLIALERQMSKRDDMLQVLGQRMAQIDNQVEHFGANHDNVWASLGSLYQDTLSTLRMRIQVQGDMRYLQQADTANRIRGLLLAGIRAARLWRQLGGHRWHLLVYRKRLLEAVRSVKHV
ncbi:high frequency lysogenization protein HflD [Halopseudomonas salegens]|uniref:High frequency lysogenization protein HflD homolog n=1 Tax=Halopseudomonas salegens TaxID=1434072 RepID=A0A1H2F796_9GAMM|nr:high frequency lysogenization protein HflD [Halopseudomonas salegens]SDU02858.1 high frequency lysogenization protein [Halopseudomonas salegens]